MHHWIFPFDVHSQAPTRKIRKVTHCTVYEERKKTKRCKRKKKENWKEKRIIEFVRNLIAEAVLSKISPDQRNLMTLEFCSYDEIFQQFWSELWSEFSSEMQLASFNKSFSVPGCRIIKNAVLLHLWSQVWTIH